MVGHTIRAALAAARRRVTWRREPSGGLRRGTIASLMLVAVLSLSACGGGDATFDIGVVISGQPTGGVIQSGSPQQVAIHAGQSLEFDASEPVQWTLEVGGSAITGSGTTVYYQGAYITVTELSDSRIALDTSAPYGLARALPITLTAVSTLDSALVATIDVLITN